MDDLARLLAVQAETEVAPPARRVQRVLVGMTGASGAAYAVDFLRRCPGEKFLVASKWARAVLHAELGLREEDLDPFVKARFADADLAAPFSSGSNPFDAYVILPCSSSTAAKIAAGIGDTLITRAAQVALKERRRLVIGVRETPLSTIQLEALTRLSREGAIVFPLSPPWYGRPETLDDLVRATTGKLLRLLGVDVPGGWHEEDLE
ncbi:MAG TPA: UbiX family flavin prenyltransferase [Candidatus Eisenbacteria bacterium]|nr:UbiX family flavin prenyltransferase [Candidatus Eisenbacteria bacterium]